MTDDLSQFIPSVTMAQADYEDTRCGEKYDVYPCRKRRGHGGVHYADTSNGCGVAWVDPVGTDTRMAEADRLREAAKFAESGGYLSPGITTMRAVAAFLRVTLAMHVGGACLCHADNTPDDPRCLAAQEVADVILDDGAE